MEKIINSGLLTTEYDCASELSNNASLLNVFITDLLPILDLGRSNLDEDIVSPTNLECIVENKNYKLESQGYKVCHWYMYQSVYFCKQKKDQSFFS